MGNKSSRQTVIQSEMTYKQSILAVASVMSLSLLYPAALRADEWSRETVFTFKESVQSPGRVLQPGTYTFRLLDAASSRHIVQVLDHKGQTLVVLFTLPVIRSSAQGKALTLSPQGTMPAAIAQWFYPGHTDGEQFVYRSAADPTTARVRHAG